MIRNRKLVLVIENDPSVRFALGRISLGQEVELSFIEAGQWTAMEPGFAAVLADDFILAGTEEKLPVTVLAERLECPVIVMSASGNKRIDSFAREAGAFSVLHKPFNVGELRRQLGKALGGAHLSSGADEGGIGKGAGAPAAVNIALDLGERIAGDQVFDDLFVELERRQPLDEGLDAFDVVERHLVKRALISCGGNQSHAARFLGITRNTLRKRIHKYGFASLLSVDERSPADEDL